MAKYKLFLLFVLADVMTAGDGATGTAGFCW